MYKEKNSKQNKKEEKKVIRGKRNNKDDEDEEEDVVMIDTSTKNKRVGKGKDADSEQEGPKDGVQDKNGKDKQIYEDKLEEKSKKYKIEPNIMSYHDPKEQKWFNYQLSESQYIVYNPDQVRLKNILHISTRVINADED